MMNKRVINLLLSFILTTTLTAQNNNPQLLSVRGNSDDCVAWVDSIYNKLTNDERIGQLFMPVIYPDNNSENIEKLRKMVQRNQVGGLLFQKGSVMEQADVTNIAQGMTKVPLLIALDGEWGLSMRLSNTVRFPRNMPLGATTNDDLMFEYGKEVARQCKAMGIHINFSPDVDINNNPKNPVIGTRSFGETPELVSRKAVAYLKGLQSEGVIAVVKHFPGHGDTSVDSHQALPVLNHSLEQLNSIELYPFRKTIEAGVDGVMTGHLCVPTLDKTPKLPASLSEKVVTGILKNEMGFKGLIFTDALAMKGAVMPNQCIKALLAGNDILLEPLRLENDIEQVKQAVQNGTLEQALLEEKVRKVLTYKYIVGLNKPQKIKTNGLYASLNKVEAQSLAQKLYSDAITLLKNENEILPLIVGKDNVASISLGTPGITTFQEHLNLYDNVFYHTLPVNATAEAMRQTSEALKNYPNIIVGIHSTKLKENDFLINLCKAHNVTLVFFVPAYQMTEFKQSIRLAKSVVMAYETADDAQRAAAETLFGGAEVCGKLPVNVENAYTMGNGIKMKKSRLSYQRPTNIGIDYTKLDEIDAIANEGIKNKAYPGCQVMVVKKGYVVYNKSFGYFDYANTHKVQTQDVYDLASLTKTTATLPAIMKLVDEKKIQLTDKIGKYLPFLKGSGKEGLTISELLYHQSGFVSFIPFYRMMINDRSYKGPLFKSSKDVNYSIQFDENSYANQNFRFYDYLVVEKRDADHQLQVADNFFLHNSFRDSVNQKIASTPLRTRGKYVYSDINFILLAEIIEQVTQEPLDEYVRKTIFKPIGADNTCYLPLRHIPKTMIAPTTNDQFLRKQLLIGYPHDEAAAVLGGIAGNAGLFSNANDIAKYLQMLLDNGSYGGTSVIGAETVKLFKESKSEVSRRGLGFDKSVAGKPASSPVSESASKTSDVFGHTGFTGTCYWVDPNEEMIYIFLSNRLYPNRWSPGLSSLNIRSRIQEVIYNGM